MSHVLRMTGGERSKKSQLTERQRSEASLREENKRRLRAEKVLRKQSEALTQTVDLMLRQPALPDFVTATLRTITREFGGMWASLWIINDRQPCAAREGSYCISGAVRSEVEAFRQEHEESVSQFSAACIPLLGGHRSPVIMPADDLRLSERNREFFKEIGVRSILVSPLWLGDRLLGWIAVFAAVPEIDSDKAAFVTAISQQMTLALHVSNLREIEHDARLAQEREAIATEREAELSLISQVLRRTAGAMDARGGIDVVLASILEGLGELFVSEHVSVWTPMEVDGTPIAHLIRQSDTRLKLENEDRLQMADELPSATKRIFIKWMALTDPVTVSDATFPSIQSVRAGISVNFENSPFCLVLPMHSSGSSIGFLLIALPAAIASSCDRLLAAKSLAQQAALAIRMNELSKLQRRASLFKERSRIARDLHDLLAQSLSGIVLQVEAIKAECKEIPQDLGVRLEKIRSQSQKSVEEVRRTLHMLRPVLLSEHSLAKALSALVSEADADFLGEIRYECSPAGLQTPTQIEPHLFAIVSEALNNAVRHSRAKKIVVKLSGDGDQLVAEIKDNGRGVPGINGMEQADGHFGLETMRHRAGLIGGTLDLISDSDGTIVRVACTI